MLDSVRAKRIFEAVHDFKHTLSKYSKNPNLMGKAIVCCQGTIEFVCNTPEDAYKKGLSLLDEDSIWFVYIIPFIPELADAI
jgi:hypothetical protein